MATNSIYTTAARALVEVEPADALRTTAAGALIEITRATGIRSTAAGALIEIIESLVSVAPVCYAHAYSPYGIVVSCTYPSGSEYNHNSFVWQWSPNGVDTWSTFATTLPSVKYARHFPLDPETTYYYRVYPARFVAGEFSNVASATTLAESELASGISLWIDVYDASNNKLGPGPLVEIARWRNVRRLNRAGEFSVEFPATYARLHQVQTDGKPLLDNDRYLYCYGIVDGAVTLLGAGIVKNAELSRSAGRAPTIVATGPDLLGELRRVTVYAGSRPYQYSLEASTTAPEDLMGDFAVTPHVPANWTITGGDATTAITAKFVHTSLLAALVDVGTKIGEYFRLGNSNNGRNLVWIGAPSAFVDCGVRAELNAEPLAAEGQADLCLITDIREITDTWDLYTKVFVFGAGSGHDRLDLIAVTHWPDGHRLRSTVSSISGSGTTVTVTTVENHELTTGNSVEIVGTATFAGTYTITVTGVKTFTFASSTAGISAAGYVYGPYVRDLDGVEYTIDLAATSLENSDARTAYGRHHTALQFKEIGPLSNSSADVSAAANALLLAAYQWLLQYSRPAKFYNLAVAKLDGLVYPGSTMRVTAKGWVEGSAYIDIDEQLTILEATTEIGAGGVRTPSLVVSTVERWPTSDGEQAASEFQQAAVYQSLAQLGPSVDTISYREHLDDDTGATLFFFLGEETAIVNQVIVRFRTDKLRSTVKSVGGSSTTTSSGGGTTATSSSGGGTTATSSSGGGTTETTTSYAPVTNHAHALEVTDLSSPAGAQLYYDTSVGLNANLGTGNDTGGSTSLVSLPLIHDHEVTIPDHTHDVTIPDHDHEVTIPDHTHDVTAAVTTEYGIYEDPGTAYTATDLEFQINGGTWRSDQAAISGASGWYALDVTTEIVVTGLRPKQVANSVAVRVKTASKTGKKAQITAQIERRCVIQSISQF